MQYLVYFAKTEENKIQLIKMIRVITQIGLREAKEFVEAKLMTDWRFTIRMTDLQLGRYLIAERLAAIEGFSFSKGYVLEKIEEIPEPRCIDITKL